NNGLTLKIFSQSIKLLKERVTGLDVIANGGSRRKISVPAAQENEIVGRLMLTRTRQNFSA
ncbi:MAG: hypothetical protein IKG61_02385, partial [Selenomonadaceae bacterium]|nr:hypothetical protein [Selenomonadaceae bacterium]